jgi:hypothetical protein
MKLQFNLMSVRSALLVFLLSLFMALGLAGNGYAVPNASAQISDTALGGGDFQYTIVLDNNGPGPIGTFWYSWIPGEDFMGAAPISTDPPAGWEANITHGGSTDGYAIQWIASSAANDLAAGAKLDFVFDSSLTPVEIAGDSPFYPSTPVDTAFAYSGAPFSDAGDRFVVTAAVAPEPSALNLLAVGALGVCFMAWRRGRTKSAGFRS